MMRPQLISDETCCSAPRKAIAPRQQMPAAFLLVQRFLRAAGRAPSWPLPGLSRLLLLLNNSDEGIDILVLRCVMRQ